VLDRGAELLGQLAHGRSGPLAPLLDELMGAGFGLWNQMAGEQRELQRRWASIGAVSAADAFADWTPAWYGSAYHSADLQIAAASSDAAARGEFLVVLGDFHGGDNPLAQGLFGLRHPDPGTRDLDRPGRRLREPQGIAERVAQPAVDAVEVLGRLLGELDALGDELLVRNGPSRHARAEAGGWRRRCEPPPRR
jgi:hypothetical protein